MYTCNIYLCIVLAFFFLHVLVFPHPQFSYSYWESKLWVTNAFLLCWERQSAYHRLDNTSVLGQLQQECKALVICNSVHFLRLHLWKEEASLHLLKHGISGSIFPSCNKTQSMHASMKDLLCSPHDSGTWVNGAQQINVNQHQNLCSQFPNSNNKFILPSDTGVSPLGN